MRGNGLTVCEQLDVMQPGLIQCGPDQRAQLRFHVWRNVRARVRRRLVERFTE